MGFGVHGGLALEWYWHRHSASHAKCVISSMFGQVAEVAVLEPQLQQAAGWVCRSSGAQAKWPELTILDLRSNNFSKKTCAHVRAYMKQYWPGHIEPYVRSGQSRVCKRFR